MNDTHDFAATKHKGLPEHVKKSDIGCPAEPAKATNVTPPVKPSGITPTKSLTANVANSVIGKKAAFIHRANLTTLAHIMKKAEISNM